MSDGRQLGRYELVTLLGRGGMGDVYEAVLLGPRGFRKPVALKVLRPGAVPDKHREALVREARLGAMLSHPNVVGTLELGEVDGRWYVAMELVRGLTTGALAQEAPIPGGAVLEIGIQACAGLAHIHGLHIDGHAAGLVHRDIKPGNLLVDRSGLVKVADLGIARLLGSGSDVAGTLGYMPPEQGDGQADARADLFALGVTLFRLATRRRPFGRGRQGLLAVHRVESLLEDPDFLAPLDVAAPGLAEVVRRCLRFDPNERWPSAGALGDALRALRGHALGGPTLLELLADRREDVRVAEAIVAGDGRSSWDSAAPTIVLGRDGLLPRPDDAFIGRVAELGALTRAIGGGEGHLWTLHGPGGAGKTRLALEVAHRLAPVLPGGAVFCDLAEASSVEGLCAAVADALDVPLERDDPVRRLGHALLARGRGLLVLDNLEQAVEPAVQCVTAWGERAPDMTLLCTSQRALGVRGERVHEVGPLRQDSAIGLLVDRSPRELAADEVAGLPALVDRLDRLPLALELAAARLRVLALPQLMDRLEDRFRLLAGGTTDRPARHRSLRASLDASWALLRGWERGALVQLSVFADGVSLQAAEAVIDLSRWPLAPWTLDVLSDLVDHALLRFDSQRGRFSMLQAVQEYAAGHDDGVERARAEARHGDWFGQLGSPGSLQQVVRRGGIEARERVAEDLENIVLASRRAVVAGRPEVAAATALAAWVVLGQRGPLASGMALLQHARDLPDAARAVELDLGILRALVLLGRATEGRERAADALRHARAGPDRLLEIDALVHVANVALRSGDPGAAETLVREAADVARAVGDTLGEVRALGTLAGLVQHAGDSEEAARLGEAALVLARRVGAQDLEARLLLNLSLVHTSLGRRQASRSALERSISLLRSLGESRSLGIALSNQSLLETEVGHLTRSQALRQEAAALGRRTGDQYLLGMALSNLGSLALLLGELDRCQALLTEAVHVCTECDDLETLSGVWSHQGRLLTVRGRHAAAEEAHQRSIELATRVGASRRLAVSEGYLGQLELERGDLEAAAPRLDRAVDHAREHGETAMLAVFGAMRALLDVRAGRDPDRAAMAPVLQQLRDEGRRLYLSEALAWWGRALLEAGEPGAAAALDEAEALARRTGAGRDGPIWVWLAAAGHTDE